MVGTVTDGGAALTPGDGGFRDHGVSPRERFSVRGERYGRADFLRAIRLLAFVIRVPGPCQERANRVQPYLFHYRRSTILGEVAARQAVQFEILLVCR